MSPRSILTALIVCLLTAATARGDYYSDSQKGWWWGDRTVEAPAEEKVEPIAPPNQPKKPSLPPPLKEHDYETIWNMHPDDFYEMQEAYKKKAVQNPSEDNVKDYYEMQEIARKKSLAFTNTSQYVWQKYPELSVAKDAPTNTPGNLSKINSSNNERLQTLKDNRDEYALVYFWQPNCPYCDDQKNILKWFQGRTDWTVKPVNIRENPALAAKIGVVTTPTLILIKRGQTDHFPVGAGVISADEVEDKVYRAIRLMNSEIAPDEYGIYDFQRGGGFDVKSRKDWVKTPEKRR